MNCMLPIIVHGMKHTSKQYLKEKLIGFGVSIGEKNELVIFHRLLHIFRFNVHSSISTLRRLINHEMGSKTLHWRQCIY